MKQPPQYLKDKMQMYEFQEPAINGDSVWIPCYHDEFDDDYTAEMFIEYVQTLVSKLHHSWRVSIALPAAYGFQLVVTRVDRTDRRVRISYGGHTLIVYRCGKELVI